MADEADIQYSEKYFDDFYEYRWVFWAFILRLDSGGFFANSMAFRHVIIPQTLAKLVPKTHLMTETEWRNLGIQQSPGKSQKIPQENRLKSRLNSRLGPLHAAQSWAPCSPISAPEGPVDFWGEPDQVQVILNVNFPVAGTKRKCPENSLIFWIKLCFCI